MNETRNKNNKVTLSGEIVSDFGFSHEIYGEKFYTADLKTIRKSNESDFIPIMVSDRFIDMKESWAGRFVRVSGQFRSCNRHEGERSRLILSVFAREIETGEFEYEELRIKYNENCIFLDGYICKQIIYRKTPLGREIADMILAVNRPYGKTDYIPCIAWGRNARFLCEFEVGARCAVWGRIQSRVYVKKIYETRSELRMAYEVSISKLEAVEAE